MTIDEILIGLIPVAFGFLLGIISEPIVGFIRKRHRRKSVGLLICSEISTIRDQATIGLPIHKKLLEENKLVLKAGTPGTVIAQDIQSGNFPTMIFSSIKDELDLFDIDLIILLTSLYNSVDTAHHWKDANLKCVNEFISIRDSFIGRATQPTPMEIQTMQMSGGESIHFVEVYIKTLELILKSSNEALLKLKSITRFEPKETPKLEMETGYQYESTVPILKRD